MAILRFAVCLLVCGCYDLSWDPASQNSAPQVRILAPEAGRMVRTPVAFLATADDVEDGDLGEGIVWRSGDTVLGVGSRIQANLAPGIHRVIASVSDTSGASGADEIDIVVEE